MWGEAARRLGVVLVAAPLALFSAILFADGLPGAGAVAVGATASQRPAKLVTANFARCIGARRITCVVDGDTIWLEGTKIRIADIDAPEISRPACEAERIAGERATARLTRWLNEGAFEVLPNPDGRDADRYGRKLRVLSRDGSSAVDALVAEGVAGKWGGARVRWC
ncbi:thermonuclease family protein [Alteriqipengyuania sp.]|uniref:thermonuclease family protein n=1 Tax=Alteriqipengyuania sp. TaxID=2800692 RepID=UPI003517E292